MHSTGSEIPLTLNLTGSVSHTTVAHLAESPPSYEEAMRISPEGCSVTVRHYSSIHRRFLHKVGTAEMLKTEK